MHPILTPGDCGGDNDATIVGPVGPGECADAIRVVQCAASSVKDTLAAVEVTSTATEIAPANAARTGLVFQSTDTDIYIGDSSVTAATGILLTAGTPFTDNLTVDAWYAITASGTADVRVLEITA